MASLPVFLYVARSDRDRPHARQNGNAVRRRILAENSPAALFVDRAPRQPPRRCRPAAARSLRIPAELTQRDVRPLTPLVPHSLSPIHFPSHFHSHNRRSAFI